MNCDPVKCLPRVAEWISLKKVFQWKAKNICLIFKKHKILIKKASCSKIFSIAANMMTTLKEKSHKNTEYIRFN